MKVLPPVLALLALPLAAQEVFVVSQGGGPGLFPSVGAALDAGADDGDVILVREGVYPEFAIDGQGVSVIADAGATPSFSSEGLSATPGFAAFPVAGLAAGDALVLRGLELKRTQPLEQNDPLIEVQANAGTVWIEDCTLTQGGPAVLVSAGARVVLKGTHATGAHGFFNGFWVVPPGAGLEVRGEATVHGSTPTGGKGMSGFFGFPSLGPTEGAAGARVHDGGRLSSLDSTFQGGVGGDGFAGFGCTLPAPGGPGLHLLPGAPEARVFGITLSGGDPGGPGEGCTATFVPGGPPLLREGGKLTLLAGPAPELEVEALAREGEVLSGSIHGLPGELAFLAFGGDAGALYLSSLNGTLLLGAPVVVLPLGAIPALTSQLTFDAPVGELGAGVSALALVLQAATCTSGSCALGTGSYVVLLDAAY